MTKRLLMRSLFFSAALALVGCDGSTKCTSASDCKAGETCDVGAGLCTPAINTGGGDGNVGGGTNTTGGGTGAGGGSGQVSNGGDTCPMAVPVTGVPITGDTTGLVDDYTPEGGCTGFLNPGADTVFKVNVPAGQRVSVRATGTTTSPDQYDLSVYLVPAPASNCSVALADGGSAATCLSGSDDPDALDAIETATWFNDTGADAEVLIVVDSGWGQRIANPDGGQGITNEGAFSLEVLVATPGGDGDRCETAVALTSGVPLANQDLSAFGNDYQPGPIQPSCAGKGSSDATYRIEVPPGDLLRVTATPSASLDLTLSLAQTAAECGKTCVAAADARGVGQAETLTWKNRSATAQTVFIVVDGNHVTTGTFSITATTSTPPADDTCAGATPLVAGTPLTGQSLEAHFNDFDEDVAGCSYQGGNDRAYTIEVPAGKRLIVDLTVEGGGDLDAIINLVEAQGACGTACLAVADDGYEGEAERLVFVNRSGAAQQYVLVIDAWYGGGDFTLAPVIDDPPPGDTCQTAPALSGSLSGESTVGYTNDYTGGAGCALTGTLDADRVYRVTVPNGERGVVTVSPALLPDGGASFSPSISLVEGPAENCDVTPRVCQGSAPGAASVRTATYFNGGAAPVDVFAIVDSSSLTGGAYDVAFTSAAPAIDDLCTSATTALAVGTPATGDLNGFLLDYGSGAGCASNSLGRERVYRLQLPANRTVTVTATPTDTSTTEGPNLYLNLITTDAATCDSAARACAVAASAVGRGLAETLRYTNFGAAPVDAFLVVGDQVANAANTTFTLSATEATIADGEACVLPEIITASGTQVGLSWVGFTRQYVVPFDSATCSSYPSAERVFEVTLAPGQTLKATATPDATNGGDPVLNLIEGPASNCNDTPTCLATSDDLFDGTVPEEVMYTNSAAAAKTVYLVIGSYAQGTFSLNIQLTP